MPRHEYTLTPLEIPTKELLDRYEKIYTAIAGDVMRSKYGLHDTCLPWTLRPLVDGSKAAGLAFTVKGMPWHKPRQKDGGATGEGMAEMELRANFMSDYYEDCIPVWECSGDEESAHYGEMMSAQSMVAGCRAAVVDAACAIPTALWKWGLRCGQSTARPIQWCTIA